MLSESKSDYAAGTAADKALEGALERIRASIGALPA
jgi:hypothetical protein